MCPVYSCVLTHRIIILNQHTPLWRVPYIFVPVDWNFLREFCQTLLGVKSMSEYVVVYDSGKEVIPSLSKEVMAKIAKGEPVTLAVTPSQAYTVSTVNGHLKVVVSSPQGVKVWVK